MNIDERLDALTQSVELLVSMQRDGDRRMKQLQELVEKHEQWHEKVERSLVAGIEAALREWKNGEEHS